MLVILRLYIAIKVALMMETAYIGVKKIPNIKTAHLTEYFLWYWGSGLQVNSPNPSYIGFM